MLSEPSELQDGIEGEDPYHQRQEQARQQLNYPQPPEGPPTPLPGISTRRIVLKLGPEKDYGAFDNMAIEPAHRMQTRRGTRQASGSEYSANASRTSESSDPALPEDEEPSHPQVNLYTSRRGRVARQLRPNLAEDDDDEDDDEAPIRGPGKRPTSRKTNTLEGFIEPDIDDSDERRYHTRSRNPRATSSKPVRGPPRQRAPPQPRPRRATRSAKPEESEDYEDHGDAEDDEDHQMEDVDVEEDDLLESQEQPGVERAYRLRERKKNINYQIPPPLDPVDVTGGIGADANGYGGGKGKGKGRARPRPPPRMWHSNFPIGRPPNGLPADDSDSDPGFRTPKKFDGTGAASGVGGSEMFAGAGPSGLISGPNAAADLAATAGTPSNLGKVGDGTLADTSPLTLPPPTFDSIGGLDAHLTSLKEMVSLPLLYPEVFQHLGITPPRGVLFHGPPGTGKTLVARALAGSLMKGKGEGGRGISFFMRKGADVLSKWVGEAERQLRLLFEEARQCQPSIIFFDEIDGLAPVRSSKQDQIHASIVSTLLALMDGMDGRGQVIVIGATNRPDAIDPALRRPGRFDREFYFPLPDLEAREKILSINTKGWVGWDGEKGVKFRKMLAESTRGFGGADLRALCTEAALNAVQRTYPQIYKSENRLLLKPETIEVQPRDFMISIKKMVPSSERSTASSAVPLPLQLVPLLHDALENVKATIDRVLPRTKKRNILEEAEWQDDGDEDGFEREMMLQAMENMRVYRPRILLHGPVGMGQNYVGPAALHYLDTFHVQSLDLGTLLSDSTRTVEAAVVQLFVEAKRHKPSILYIPSLVAWCAAVSETARTTVRAMLDSLAPTDPILLLAVVDGPLSQIPSDVREWFGHGREHRVAMVAPTESQRTEFFADLIKNIQKPPNQFPDAAHRKKRVLEDLPLAPPSPPRTLTSAEIAVQKEADEKTLATLNFRLAPVMQELKKKFKRFTKPVMEEYNLDPETDDPFGDAPVQRVETEIPPVAMPNGIADPTTDGTSEANPNGTEQQPHVHFPPPRAFKFHDINLEIMHAKLYYEGYLTTDDFLADLELIVHNTTYDLNDSDRHFKAQQMLQAARLTFMNWDSHFRLECERMAVRERARRAELKEGKRKNKTNGNSHPNASNYANGTRRSGRTNGQKPELAPTDPLQLERRLKRQRTEGGETSQSSGAENVPSTPKRARTSASDDDADGEVDPMNIVNDGSPRPHHEGQHVRFANELVPLSPRDDMSQNYSIPDPLALGSLPILDPEAPEPALVAAHGSLYAPNLLPPDASNVSIVTQPEAPFSSIPHDLVPVEDAGPQEIERMRTPTPPLPTFTLDTGLLDDLSKTLVHRTAGLNVEQLEQLRAACLHTVWSHRAEWNRDGLVQEVQAVVNDFVNDVDLNDTSMEM